MKEEKIILLKNTIEHLEQQSEKLSKKKKQFEEDNKELIEEINKIRENVEITKDYLPIGSYYSALDTVSRFTGHTVRVHFMTKMLPFIRLSL